MEQNFVFECTPLEPDALIPQVSQALEVRMEFVSRAVCPSCGLRLPLNRTKKKLRSAWARRRPKGQVLGLVNWIMALLLLFHSFSHSKNSLLLSIAGGLCLGACGVELWRCCCQKRWAS